MGCHGEVLCLSPTHSFSWDGGSATGSGQHDLSYSNVSIPRHGTTSMPSAPSTELGKEVPLERFVRSSDDPFSTFVLSGRGGNKKKLMEPKSTSPSHVGYPGRTRGPVVGRKVEKRAQTASKASLSGALDRIELDTISSWSRSTVPPALQRVKASGGDQVKPFYCPEPSCSGKHKFWSTQGDLNKHIQRCHRPEQERPHLCLQCGRRFNHPRELHRHNSSVHAGEKWVCDICGAHLSRSDNLERHVRSKHSDTQLQPEAFEETPSHLLPWKNQRPLSASGPKLASGDDDFISRDDSIAQHSTPNRGRMRLPREDEWHGLTALIWQWYSKGQSWAKMRHELQERGYNVSPRSLRDIVHQWALEKWTSRSSPTPSAMTLYSPEAALDCETVSLPRSESAHKDDPKLLPANATVVDTDPGVQEPRCPECNVAGCASEAASLDSGLALKFSRILAFLESGLLPSAAVGLYDAGDTTSDRTASQSSSFGSNANGKKSNRQGSTPSSTKRKQKEGDGDGEGARIPPKKKTRPKGDDKPLFICIYCPGNAGVCTDKGGRQKRWVRPWFSDLRTHLRDNHVDREGRLVPSFGSEIYFADYITMIDRLHAAGTTCDEKSRAGYCFVRGMQMGMAAIVSPFLDALVQESFLEAYQQALNDHQITLDHNAELLRENQWFRDHYGLPPQLDASMTATATSSPSPAPRPGSMMSMATSSSTSRSQRHRDSDQMESHTPRTIPASSQSPETSRSARALVPSSSPPQVQQASAFYPAQDQRQAYAGSGPAAHTSPPREGVPPMAHRPLLPAHSPRAHFAATPRQQPPQYHTMGQLATPDFGPPDTMANRPLENETRALMSDQEWTDVIGFQFAAHDDVLQGLGMDPPDREDYGD